MRVESGLVEGQLFARRKSGFEAPKKAARPELCKKEDWSDWTKEQYASQDLYDTIQKVQANDTIKRITGVDISNEEFRRQYENTDTPVVLTKVTRHWQANEKDCGQQCLNLSFIFPNQVMVAF